MALDVRTVTVGTDLHPLVKGPITREDLRRYAAASGDPNPMHTDEEFARNAGYPGVFAHGMLSMGYLGEFLVQAGGGGAIPRLRGRLSKVHRPGGVGPGPGRGAAGGGGGGAGAGGCGYRVRDP